MVITEADFGQLLARWPTAPPVGLTGVRRWIRAGLGDDHGVQLEITGQEPLIDGDQADPAVRLSATAWPTDGEPREISLVMKPARRREIRALRSVQAVEDATALPTLVDHGWSPGRGWLVTPWYPGTPARTPADIPTAVFDTLARTHAHFLLRADDLAGIPRLDAECWRRICTEELRPTLVRAYELHPHETLAAGLRTLDELTVDCAMDDALARLPHTLVHGDLRPASILRTKSKAVILNWSSAYSAPAMLDLAAVASPRSAGYSAYTRRWRQLSGQQLEKGLATIGYRWATVVMSLRELASASSRMDLCAAAQAVERARRNRDTLGAALRGKKRT